MTKTETKTNPTPKANLFHRGPPLVNRLNGQVLQTIKDVAIESRKNTNKEDTDDVYELFQKLYKMAKAPDQ